MIKRKFGHRLAGFAVVDGQIDIGLQAIVDAAVADLQAFGFKFAKVERPRDLFGDLLAA